MSGVGLRKQKKKKGRVVRLSPGMELLVELLREEGETVSATLERLILDEGDTRYALPSDLFLSLSEARGAAVLKATRGKTRKTEQPIAVRIEK